MKSIAILHFTAPPVVGGVESVLGQHARLLAGAGHSVRVVAGRGEMVDGRIRFVHLPLADSRHPAVSAAKVHLDAGQIPAGFETLVNSLAGELEQALAGVEIVLAHNVCSLHKNLALTAALHRFCARPAGPHLVAWHHDLAWLMPQYQPELHLGWPWDLIRQPWPGVGQQHVAVSQLRQQEVAQLFGLPLETISVVPAGLDASTFLKLEPETVELVRRLRLLEADPLLLLPVRITRRKNIELALQVLAALRPFFPPAALVVTGPPGPHNAANLDYFTELKKLAAALDLASPNTPAVHFLADVFPGYVPDPVIGDLYRLADALLLPSREEGFGIPLLEAGLRGLPIFCADIPSLREIAGQAATYFSPDGEPASIAARIADRLAADPVFQLRRRVRRNYTWEGVYADCIEPLLERG
ncbi:MAG: glycosyltransferase [Chloroflexi bacterium]|nr:glycosyltransferase [Chloroflexota bacterium]MCI0580444.1 glycosyltransferase [Chloroflexota bacterium]MCI0649188.1 glycosyltransferase [Chloroflexota bacterium]MCI0728000.1 glycosyltransferase [Chloroflexota bacterium]